MIDRFQAADAGFTDQAEELKARAFEYAETARARLAEGSNLLKDYVTKQPVRAVGIALGVGVVLGWLILTGLITSWARTEPPVEESSRFWELSGDST